MSKITPLEDLALAGEYAEDAPGGEPVQYAAAAPQPQMQYSVQLPPVAVAPQPAAPEAPSMWQTVMELGMSPVFLKTLAVTFAIAFAALLFPIEDYVLKNVSFLDNVPHAGLAVKALAISVAATFWRPPPMMK